MFKIGSVFLAITGAMWLIFDSAQWYADHAALPRYCDDPHTTVQPVGQIQCVRPDRDMRLFEGQQLVRAAAYDKTQQPDVGLCQFGGGVRRFSLCPLSGMSGEKAINEGG